MTQTKKMIIDELNKTYEDNPSKENENKLYDFVKNELKAEVIFVRKKLIDTVTAGFLTLFASFILAFGFILQNTTNTIASGIIIFIFIIFVIIYMKFWAKNEHTLSTYLFKLAKFKNFKNFFLIEELRSNHDFEEKEQSLVAKYLDRNGNSVEVEKFKCKNPKESIIVSHTEYPKFTYSENLGLLCRAVLIQREIFQRKDYDEMELGKGSIQAFNNQMVETLSGLIQELNVAEDIPDYGHIKQLLEKYEKESKCLD